MSGHRMRAIPKTFLSVFLLCLGGLGAAQTLTGSWAFGGPAESGLWLDTEQNTDTIKFQLEISRGAPSYNSGWIDGEVVLKNGVGHFKRDTDSGLCEISFRFQPKRVELKQLGDFSGCGFGYSVFATGVLKRTSHKKPKFCAGDARSGGCGDTLP